MRLADFPVDVWLVFGSFVYGFEGIIVEVSDSHMIVHIGARSPEESDELATFFEEIAANPRDLVKSEVRVYCDGPEQGTAGVAFPVSLFTDVSPLVPDGPKPRVRFSLLRGVSEADQAGWRHLVHELWPRH